MAKAPPAAPHPFADDELVIALWGWGSDEFTVKEGDRLRGSDGAVHHWPASFTRDGVSDSEKQRMRQQAWPLVERAAHVPVAEQPRPLEDEDAVICIRNVRMAADGDVHLANPLVFAIGMQLPKDHPFVRKNPDYFVPMIPPGRTRDNSVRALSGWTGYKRLPDGSYEQEPDPMKRMQNGNIRQYQRWYAGQYVDKNLPEVREYPAAFEHL